jgi:hypothetical protein
MQVRQKHGRIRFLLTLFCFCILARQASPQQNQKPEDPEDEKQIGLWIDQGLSAGLWTNKSLEIETHQRFDEGMSNLFEYFVQGGIAFRLRPWLSITPYYRYQRFPGNPTTAYENRLFLNVTVTAVRGTWRPSLRTLVEERFPDNSPSSARLRFRPGVEYTLPFHTTRRPVLVVNNEFFVVPGNNSFAANGNFTQNRFQIGVRLPITQSFSIRPYFMWQSVNIPTGWDTNGIFGISAVFRFQRKAKGIP